MKYQLKAIVFGFIIVLGLLVHSSVYAQVVTPASLIIENNELKAKLSLNSAIEVDLTLEFENSIGLNAANIEISAELLDPNDPNITSRLPSILTSAVSGFPVVVSVKPKANKGFAFEGLATIEVYTKAIHYTPTIPWRLFTSHNGGMFEDITSLTSSGSFRARGNTGRFSDFIILLDSRPAGTVIQVKANNIAQNITENESAISAPLLTSIQVAMSDLNAALALNDYSLALDIVDALITTVENASGNEIDDVWHASDNLVNVKGTLLSQLLSLRYSLRILD